jgi:putative hydrolase of the HAD superfamily
MALRFLLLDVDNTLYARSCGIVERIDRLIDAYVMERLGTAPAAVGALRAELRREHGTTLRGLMHRHAIDPDDYLRFVHAVELADVLGTDGALVAMLARIALPKVAVTNASSSHARAVLGHLGVEDHFLRVYALEQMAYVPKPAPEAFRCVLADLPAAAAECVLVEDSGPNLTSAHRLGMRTVHVHDGQPRHPDAEVGIGSILELEDALARLG